MIADFARQIAQGYAAPRASARGILSAGLTVPDAVLIAVLAYIVEAISQILVPGARMDEETDALSRHGIGLITQIGILFAIAGLVSGFGRAAGGTGTYAQSLVIVAWHALVTSFLAPVALYAVVQIQGVDFQDPDATIGSGPLLALLLFAGMWLWLLASYISELHGFKNIAGVMGAVVVISMAASLLMGIVVSGLS